LGVCDGKYYHHVTCSESVRLVDGAGLCSGRVEVKSNQSWASVCEADFDRQDAEVVCGEFGCGAPAALQGGLYGEGEGQTWDKEFQCKGKESLLLDCDNSDRKHNTCLPGNAVGLTCSEPDDVRVRLGIKSSSVKAMSPFSWTVTPQTERTTPAYLVMLLLTCSGKNSLSLNQHCFSPGVKNMRDIIGVFLVRK
uniref:SRCR domain-containing protein n=1 Tax=Oncorhynchus mykiss TaxID=8022 RepID=A0A8K9V4Z4_ONCMY